MPLYKYKSRGPAVPDFNSGKALSRTTAPVVTAGTIQGKKASDLEMMVGTALREYDVPFAFRASISPLMMSGRSFSTALDNLPGAVEIDFLAEAGTVYPILVEGEIAHFYTAWQRDADWVKEAIINDFARAMGWHPVIRLPFTKLVTQDMAKQTVREAIGL